MRESENIIEICTRLQLFGVLYKKPFGHQSNKWTKRFFVVKDGYLLYYAENEKRDFERKQYFNIHPKGCLPLGACHFEPMSEPGHPFSIHITSEEMNGKMVLATESEYEQDKWIDTLRHGARITWNNAKITDAVIRQQEIQGLQMAEEKQNYYDQLQNEAMALHDQKQRTEELERIREELEKEKKKMEGLAHELKQQYDNAKRELDDMTLAVKNVEEEKYMIDSMSEKLQLNLEELEKERQKTLHELEKQSIEALKLSQENKEMSQYTQQLTLNLKKIEDRTQLLKDEKKTAEESMKEVELRAQQLEEEKKLILDHAEELKESIKDLAAQKDVTEAQLKEEVMARMEAERRLKEAELSLHRLEKDVLHDGSDGRNMVEVREEMIGDVKTLKQFFENLAFEAKLDADKPIMIKNSIHARKAMVRRAKTMRYEMTRKKKSRTKRHGSYDNLESIFDVQEET